MVVGEGVSAFEFAVACEVFGVDRSDDGVPAVDFAVCSAGPGPLRSTQGFSLIADHRLDRLTTADLVLVTPSKPDLGPGGEELTAQLWAAVARGARVVSLCSAAFTLARAGLLDGRRATTHHMYAARLAAEFPRVRVLPDVLYVEDGPIATSAGTAAAADLCLHLVRAAHGTAAAMTVARRMVVPPHRDGGQAQYVQAPVRPVRDRTLQAAMAWAGEHLHEQIDVERWSRQATMSTRSFARRFLAETGATPHQWLVEQRVALARLLLEEGDEGVDQVARRCGFGSAAALRQQFARLVGTTPTGYRRAFRGSPPRPDVARPTIAVPRRAAESSDGFRPVTSAG